MAYKPDEYRHVNFLWEDTVADSLDPVERLRYRSNLLGADQRITNTGGGNTSSKLYMADPLTGEEVEVLWVKGSGGDVGSMKLDGFAQLRDDGTTSCGCWLYSGAWTEKGNMMARRDNSDPSGLGNTLNWAFAWPANRRVLYNRASCDPSGKPWDPNRKLVWWDGSKWTGADVPDFKPDVPPGHPMGPFIMQPAGAARLFALDTLAEGPCPDQYEPFKTANDTNPLHPKVISNPAARVFKDDLEDFGKSATYPYAGTTYRVTEHFHFWTKHTRMSSILQPQQFVEIGEELARQKGISAGDWVKVWSNRGFIKAVAVVTKRIKPLKVNGKTVHHVGIPIHWGFKGIAKAGYLANTLTPFVGDANTQTPEFKSFLVNIEKA